MNCMNCGLRHFGNNVMQLSYRLAPICANFYFSFLNEVVRDQKRPTAPSLVVNFSLPSNNSRNHSVTFCWFIRSPYTATICLWISALRNAPRICRDFGSALQFQTRLTQTKPILPLSKEHDLQVKDQGRRQWCHTKHKKFPYRPTRAVSLLYRHAY
jgi:hypothetical protein